REQTANRKNSKPKAKQKGITPINTHINTSLRRLRNHLELAFIALAFTCSAVSPVALARPRPTTLPGEDRGNNNSAAENVDALNINTTGLNNTAHGWHSLSTNTGGSDNTGNGFETLFTNTAGRLNTATGSQALFSNTDGIENTATSDLALFSNTS